MGVIAHAGGRVQHWRLITLGTRAEGLAMRPTMSAELSRRVIDATVAQAAAMAVVTVDESGVLKELRRMDGAPLISVQTAVSKAYAAAAIGMPPDEFYAAIESDGAAVASFATRPGLALIGGGMPVVADGQVAGAVGVAGAITAAEDRRIAEAAIDRARRQGGRALGAGRGGQAAAAAPVGAGPIARRRSNCDDQPTARRCRGTGLPRQLRPSPVRRGP